MQAPTIRLTFAEMQIAAQVAIQRVVQNLKVANGQKAGDDRVNRYGSNDKDIWQRAIQGCFGEMAIAKYLGIYWTGAVGDWSANDVGEFEVRCTHHLSGSLIVHKEDPDDKTFALVCGRGPDFRLPGCIKGAIAKREGIWRTDTGRPAFFFPQGNLSHIETLRYKLSREATDVEASRGI